MDAFFKLEKIMPAIPPPPPPSLLKGIIKSSKNELKKPKSPLTTPEIKEGDSYIIARKNGEYAICIDNEMVQPLIKILEAMK